MRVLHVEDDRVNALLFEEACRCIGGIELESAGTGADALEILAGFAPQLLVIDLHLPDTDGYALLPALRRRIAGAAVPAYLCTADEDAHVGLSARAAGFDGCWSKPIELSRLRTALQACGHAVAPGAP